MEVKFTAINKLYDLNSRIDVDNSRFNIEILDLNKELKASKAESLHLKESLLDLEKSHHKNLQHSRKWNVEIDGIPAAVGDDPVQLKAAALNLFNGINVDCIPNDIQAIHHLPSKFSPKPTIIRFTHRSTVENIFKNKNKLKHLNTLNLDTNGLEEDSKIFICPKYVSIFQITGI